MEIHEGFLADRFFYFFFFFLKDVPGVFAEPRLPRETRLDYLVTYIHTGNSCVEIILESQQAELELLHEPVSRRETG